MKAPSLGVPYPTRVILGALRGYQLIVSPALLLVFGIRCRYEENCSSFMMKAINHHGISVGLAMGLKRLLTCHPFCR